MHNMSTQMKQLKSSYQDLRDLYDHNISVKYILEPLQSCRADEDSAVVRKRMEDKDFDVMGIEENGEVYGYVERSTLTDGPCGKHSKIFHPSELIAESAPLTAIFSVLHDAPRIFVLKGTKVMGIVTRGDLQKAPVRLWLFGLITLLEMYLLHLVRIYYPENSWQCCISGTRLSKANKLFDERKKRNEAIDLADCLELCDKMELVLKISSVKQLIKNRLEKTPEHVLDSIKKLRDRLAHAQDLVTGSTWPNVIDSIKDIEQLLESLELAGKNSC